MTATARADLGTPETRRRVAPDPLLSTDLQVHRALAGAAIREALEEGLDAAGLDIVRIGLGGGASSSGGGWTPQERLIESRWWLRRWRDQCAKLKLRNDLAELWATGNSIRSIAAAHGMNRPGATAAVEAAVDAYADLRGFRRTGPVRTHIAVWDDPEASAARTEAGFAKAAVRNRNTREN